MDESICEKCVHRNVCGFYEPGEECGACNQFIDKSRFIELPYKVGSEVAVIRSKTSDDKNIYITIERISHYRVLNESARMCFDSCRLSIPDYRWKKDVFTGETAREKAEATLAERMKDETWNNSKDFRHF